MDDEDPPNIIPFGKHKGKTIQEVQIVEPGYLDWLEGQPWFRDKFVILHQTIINRGAEPEETPDHNALQVLFLDDAFCLKFVSALGCNPAGSFERWKLGKIAEIENKLSSLVQQMGKHLNKEYTKKSEHEIELTKSLRFEPSIENRAFEAQGWDVVFEAPYAGRFQIEIKPAVGDDYPAILRQINALRRQGYGSVVLFLERYIGIGATVEQFKTIFKSSDIAVVFRHEVEG